ncbi:MAG: hypothetical protein HC880_03035 [Bacteroidia bacterium]|nr:hypothetical protein [Bacteroidia bacterium]
MPKNTKLTFEITLEEANLIFKALGKLPFVEVYELIGKLNDQANRQLDTKQTYNHPTPDPSKSNAANL